MNHFFISFFCLSVLNPVAGIAATKTVDFDLFKTQVNETAGILKNSDDCRFIATEVSAGIKLTVVTSDTTVTIVVPKSKVISFSEKIENDGSFQLKYSVVGTGILSITHVDDAFDSITLKNSLNKTMASCGIYY